MKALAAPLIHWSVARVFCQGGLQDGLLTVHVLNILRSLMRVLQEPVLVFGSFEWECTGQELKQADSSVAEVAAQQDDDVPVKVAAAEAVAVAGEVARQGTCALPTMAAQQSAGLQVLKVFSQPVKTSERTADAPYMSAFLPELGSPHVMRFLCRYSRSRRAPRQGRRWWWRGIMSRQRRRRWRARRTAARRRRQWRSAASRRRCPRLPRRLPVARLSTQHRHWRSLATPAAARL